MGFDALHYLALIFAFLSVMCCCTNSLIVIATWRTKTLHSCCNILIAFCAFSDIIHSFGQLPKIIPILFGDTLIASYTCCMLEIIPNFGLSTGVIIILLIAIDRFIAVQFQKYYLVKDQKRYLLCHCLAIIGYAAFQYAIAYIYFENRDVVCSPPEMYHGFAKKIWGLTAFTVIAFSIVIYYLVWLKLKYTVNIGQDHRVFRSIFAVMCVIILGWLLSMSIFNFVKNVLNLECRYEMYVGVDISGIPVNTAVSLNCPVLYFTSNDYRRAFRQQLRSIPWIGRWIAAEDNLILSTVTDTYLTEKTSVRQNSVSHQAVDMTLY